LSRANRTTRPPRGRRRETRKEAAAAPHATRRVLAAGLAVYLGILAAMVAFDSYTFVLKGAVLPFLLAVAVLSRRFGPFVNDWALFLGAVVFFDSLRSLAFAATTHFELPMYAVYAIDWERWLCGGVVAPVGLQEMRASLSDPLWLDRFFVLLHASHFLFFLLFGFVLWYLGRAAFRTYAAAMVALLYLALLVQFLVPTIPPWMAADDFMLLPPTARIFRSIYNVQLPALVAVFDVNPIAAMPSLHAAMPILCALLALHYLGRAGLAVAVYAAGVSLAVLYLGEHYLVDVVAGGLLAFAVYGGVRRFGASSRSFASPEAIVAHERPAARPILAAVLLVASAFGVGQLAGAWLAPLPVTRTFVERELVGRSPGAHYLLGRIAFAEGDFARARVELSRALEDLPHPEHQKVIRSFLNQAQLSSFAVR
jgi:hypothetical protein